MADSLEGNPFAALFSSVKAAEEFRQQQQEEQQLVLSNDTSEKKTLVNENDVTKVVPTSFLEDILLVTTSSNGPVGNCPCVLIVDTPELNSENLDFVLFERLLFNDLLDENVLWPRNGYKNIKKQEEAAEFAVQSEVVIYLFNVYQRCWSHRDGQYATTIQQLMLAVVNNLATAIEQPEIYGDQEPSKQYIKLIRTQLSNSAALEHLFFKYLDHISGQDVEIPDLFNQVMEEITIDIAKCSLMSVDWSLISVVDIFSSSPFLAPILVRPPEEVTNDKTARRYQHTVLGSLLAISCLPKNTTQEFEYFLNPSAQPSQAHKATEHSIWIAQSNLHSRVHKIFLSLLKVSKDCKDGLLRWIEGCLQSNSGRAGLWHIESGGVLQSTSYVTDGFMINLGAVMLQLTAPFTIDMLTNNDIQTHKIMKVDPTYCCVPSCSAKPSSNSVNVKVIPGAYTADLPQQTCLNPRENTYKPTLPESYTFITSCFFLTHRTLHLGVQVVHQKLHKCSQDLGRLEQDYEELSAQGSPASEMMRKHMESRITRLLSFKAAVFENQLTENLLQFLTASVYWLMQVSLKPADDNSPGITAQRLSLPLPSDDEDQSQPLMQCIPELIVENVVEALGAMKRYSVENFALASEPVLTQLMSFIAVFMGSSQKIYNPHVRAHLSDCLESLMPQSSSNSSSSITGMGTSIRDRLFLTHPLAPHLVTAIVHVFVSIETTGQSVQFEEKFNYRRPMYEVMKYLWTVNDHRRQFVVLADYALAHMEAAKPPLFLRFVNLLINDAIFLLDEGLSYMSQLREMLIPPAEETHTEQEQRERNIRHMSMLARFHNMLGTHTIQMLIRISKEVKRMLNHRVLVDRMAAMLNHFLTHLVGPNQRNLKVRDMEKYEFRPGDIVSDICSIYINLSPDESFCHAVSADGRSYSPKLFIQACHVLNRIARRSLSEEMEAVGEKVKKIGLKRLEDEDLAATAPEEYLDPIMSHLMVDPVTLPTSNVICDRSTIARHLLSDQSDPFNRQPLTMEDVITNDELRNTIQTWLQQQRELKHNKQKEEEQC